MKIETIYRRLSKMRKEATTGARASKTVYDARFWGGVIQTSDTLLKAIRKDRKKNRRRQKLTKKQLNKLHVKYKALAVRNKVMYFVAGK